MWKRLKMAALALPLAAMLGATPSAPAQAGGLLKVPDADWTGAIVTCRLIEFIINDWGYKVKRITMPSGPAVSEGMRAGDLDYACESWPSYSTTKEKYIKYYGGDGSVEYLDPVGIVGQSGYYVPRYVIEGDSERGIKAVAPDLQVLRRSQQIQERFQDT